MNRLRQLLLEARTGLLGFHATPETALANIGKSLREEDIPGVVDELDSIHSKWEELEKEDSSDREPIDALCECSSEIDRVLRSVDHVPAAPFFVGLASPHAMTRWSMAETVARLSTVSDLPRLQELLLGEQDKQVRTSLQAAVDRLSRQSSPRTRQWWQFW